MKRGTLYDYSAIEKFISHLCDNGWECYNVWEGCLTSGDWICIAPDDKHYNFIIKEVYLNEWSSAQTVRRCAKLSKKQLSLIDELLDKED